MDLVKNEEHNIEKMRDEVERINGEIEKEFLIVQEEK